MARKFSHVVRSNPGKAIQTNQPEEEKVDLIATKVVSF